MRRVVNAIGSKIMKRSKNEVARWRMLRQAQRKRTRWLEGQSRRYRRIHGIRYQLAAQQRRSVLFINTFW
jgi:hypothetical protein